MSPDKFRANSSRDVGKGKAPCLFGEARVENNQEQQITQFILDAVKISAGDRVDDFVSLFEEHPFHGVEILSTVPCTPLRATQVRGQFYKSG